MKVNLMGVQSLDFTNDKNERIQGIKLHIAYKDQWVSGLKCDSKFVSAEACHNLGISAAGLDPLIGKPVELDTDLKGRVLGVTAV